jgi:hypothetical protein
MQEGHLENHWACRFLLTFELAVAGFTGGASSSAVTKIGSMSVGMLCSRSNELFSDGRMTQI